MQEIRKQADDVFYSLPFPLQFLLKIDVSSFHILRHNMIHIIKRLKFPLWTCSGQNLHHVHAIQCPEDRRICETTWIKRPETSSSSTWGSHPLNILEEIITLFWDFVGSSQEWLFLRAQTLMRWTQHYFGLGLKTVWKSSSEGNHTTDGYHVHSFRRYPAKPWRHIKQSRQSSYRKWFVCWCR